MSTGVFARSGADDVSERGFYAALSASLIWGLVVTAFVANKAAELNYDPGIIEVIMIGLVIPIIGAIVAKASDNPIVSFIGYNMIVVPFGLILAPLVNHYSPNIIRNAFAITALISVVMGSAGIMFPAFFSRLGPVLFLALICLLIVRIAQVFIVGLDLVVFDYIAAGIFSLYVGYDMYRASSVPRTINNAVDVSIDLYLDVVNLFVSILRIVGSGDTD